MCEKNSLIKGLPGNESIHFRYKGRRECIFVKDIIYIESDRVYSIIFFSGNDIESKKLCHSLLEFEEQLKDKGFLRCSRYHLVNIDKVKYFCSQTRFIFFLHERLRISIRKLAKTISVLLEKGIKDASKQIV
jgi:DNA-binding LytR/AlgR family response regulator